ncbi:MED7-member of RNA polymerase II transcriptional regulation mediator complex [Apiospora hydei]|uniref:Mediator of RNA polymerase II transcription subunit 7 n=1 Tax=Apiospora hydei TaxID=1337664 RepID=A0ABR1UTA9_9PEZI
MADPNEAQEMQDLDQITSTWPRPPPFYKNFTADNLARLADLKRERAETSNPPSNPDAGTNNNKDDILSQRLTGLPANLRNLQPPLPPDEGAWRIFGDPYRLVQPLPKLEEGARFGPWWQMRDDKHFDRATVLKRIAKSLLLNFLELVGILGQNAMDASEKVKDIRDLFYNFHHLINEYRPHQARESLIATMQAQLDRLRAETTAIRDSKEKVERMLEGLGSLKIDQEEVAAAAAAATTTTTDKSGAAGRGMGELEDEMWGVLSSLLSRGRRRGLETGTTIR